jgi:hypothetical protein
MNGNIRRSMDDWKRMQYELEDAFRIRITDPPDVIRDLEFVNVEVEFEDGTVKHGVGITSGVVLLRM